ncbi:T9SS type A sorting domain-containing protein [Gaetbulibacter saemankumensis]|uniref:T9SS type A sorting domain-containing protein n=1 Tax=Gaetbulibacter saemankumensis TaxID=311208 RepID=UPI00041447FD|nr:T9SS type A sorting domain-containing protein [Gaetbulibacter saemankumensis]
MKDKLPNWSPNLILKTTKNFILILAFLVVGLTIVSAQNSNANSNGTDHANENATVYGGVISTMDNTEVCVGDGVPDLIDVIVEDAAGRLKQWVITDDENNILALPENPPFDFDGGEPGNCRIWHLSYNGIKPLVDPFWHKHVVNLSDIKGKFDLSNYIEVTRIQQPRGGEIALEDGSTEIEICSGDGVSDEFQVVLEGAEGPNMLWVVTDTEANIIKTSTEPIFDFEGEAGGVCLIWHLSYAENVSLEGVENANELMGCFDLSNPITVNKIGVNAGAIEIAGGETAIEICAGDGESDAFDVNIIGDTEGSNFAWVITNEALDILDIQAPETMSFDLEGAGDGVCLIWRIAFEDGLTGAEIGQNAADLMGCFNLSNAITVTRHGVNAGAIEIAGGETAIEICAGDGESDAFDVNIVGDTEGANFAWVITNETLDILDIQAPETMSFDLEGAGDGVCLIWRIAFEDGLTGAEIGQNAGGLMGCFNLSNAITVTRNGVNGGVITGGEENTFSFTVGDDTADHITEGAITLEENIGPNSKWLVTNADGTIIMGVADSYTEPNFDEAEPGTCLLWHLSYQDGLEGLEPVEGEGHLVANLSGCFSLSNAITILRTAPEASGKVALYPNPSKSYVTIDVSEFSKEPINLSVLSLQNSKLLNENGIQNKEILLDVSDYNSGIYFIKVTSTKTGISAVKRLIVN